LPKIPNSILPEVYKTARAYANGTTDFNSGVEHLFISQGLNKTSAGYYLSDFRQMLAGKLFKRTMSGPSFNFLLEGIYIDYDYVQFQRALSAFRQHIDYLEGIRNIKFAKLRSVLLLQEGKLKSPYFISTFDHIKGNILELEKSLTEGTPEEQAEAARLIQKGICFIAYSAEKETRFIPSRFAGYSKNQVFLYHSPEIDGRETNKVLDKIFGFEAKEDENLEDKYLEFCLKLGISTTPTGTFGNQRKYWSMLLDHQEDDDQEIDEEFPEGAIVSRMHRNRERDPKVIKAAKKLFKKKHGKLFCEICLFDFEQRYGNIGKDFIEGHHTIAVTEMQPGHKTKIEDIAMLCSNCHRMVHIKRPWLHMEDLKTLLLSNQYNDRHNRFASDPYM
jgi:predicted HNH restriction endonuclease